MVAQPAEERPFDVIPFEVSVENALMHRVMPPEQICRTSRGIGRSWVQDPLEMYTKVRMI